VVSLLTDAAFQLTVKWACSSRTSLRDIEVAQSEIENALDSVELQQMVGWLATQYQRLAAKAERDGQYASAVCALNALRAMVVKPPLDAQFALTSVVASRTRPTGADALRIALKS